MLAFRTRAASVGAAVLVLGALFGASAAHAAVYNGSWDPAYGGIFPDLGWEAAASFNVPSACLSQANGTYAATGQCAGFSVLSAELSFYDVASPGIILETFDLGTGVNVNGIEISGGNLVGIDTGYFGAVVPTGASASIAGNGDYGFSLTLYGGKLAQLVYADPPTVSPVCATFPVTGAACGFSANPAQGTFTLAVPEPGTYALLLGGLGLVAWTARRRGARTA